MAEYELSRQYLDRLRQDFIIEEQVKGRHFSGKLMIIDAVARPIQSNLWKNPDVALGIEFKDIDRFDKSYDTNNYTKWLSQCVDYAHTDWEGAGYIHIFACPDLIGSVAKGAMESSFFVQNFMSQLGVGELKELERYGLTFILSSQHRIWSEYKGVESGKHYGMKRKFGSR